jgi:hypothetical protein
MLSLGLTWYLTEDQELLLLLLLEAEVEGSEPAEEEVVAVGGFSTT